MDINQELSLDTELPFQSVQELEMNWELNEHAGLRLSGILENGCGDEIWSRDYVGTQLAVTMAEPLEKTGDRVLFRGLIREVKLFRNHGVGMVHLEAASASIKMDDNGRRLCRSFQNPTLTYPEIAGKMADIGGGAVICTTEKEKIERLFICYEETVWEFLKRLASHQNSFLISDIKTGRPSLWMGMRSGKQIEEDLTDRQTDVWIQKKYDKGGKSKAVKIYRMEGHTHHSIGDWMMDQGEKYIICAVTAKLQQGDISFSYLLASEGDIRKEPIYNEALTGMSLWGTVEEAKKETVRITFDMDREEGNWFYPWRPETGNALYAMPEVGTKAAVYFMNHDEGSGIAIRCSGQLPESQKPEDKSMTTAAEGKAELFAGSLGMGKEKERMEIRNSGDLSLSGVSVEIEASGKVRLRAREISVNALSEIKATTEQL